MCDGPSTCLEYCRCNCDVWVNCDSGKWNRVASSTLFSTLDLASGGKKRKIKAVTKFSISLASLNLKPLRPGASNNEKAVTRFCSTAWLRAAVLDEATKRINTS